MVFSVFGVGGMDNSHDCILLIQLHHLAFGGYNPQNCTEFYTWGNNIAPVGLLEGLDPFLYHSSIYNNELLINPCDGKAKFLF